jgi:RNA polymerase sigma-70 factor (ECF subfamily)
MVQRPGDLATKAESDEKNHGPDSMLSHGSALRAYFRKRVRNIDDVDDYVQEVYARVLSAGPSQKIDSWRGFLLRVASNLITDGFRRDQARMKSSHITLDDILNLTDGMPTAEDCVHARQQLEALTEALSSVEPMARDVFLLVRVEGLTHREAAERFGIETKQASRHIERVLAQLTRALARNSSR